MTLWRPSNRKWKIVWKNSQNYEKKLKFLIVKLILIVKSGPSCFSIFPEPSRITPPSSTILPPLIRRTIYICIYIQTQMHISINSQPLHPSICGSRNNLLLMTCLPAIYDALHTHTHRHMPAEVKHEFAFATSHNDNHDCFFFFLHVCAFSRWKFLCKWLLRNVVTPKQTHSTALDVCKINAAIGFHSL